MTQDESMDSGQLAFEAPAEEALAAAVHAVAKSLDDDSASEESAPAESPAESPAEPADALAVEPAVAPAVDEPAPLEELPELDAQEAAQPTPEAEPAQTEPEAVEGLAATEPPGEEPVPEPRATRVAWWPFIAIGVLWIGLAATAYLLLTSTQAQLPAFRQDAYPYLVLAGLVLTLLGPLIALATWLFAWFKAKKPERGGMLTTALVRGAIVTFLGVVVWWGVLVLVDALRLGLV